MCCSCGEFIYGSDCGVVCDSCTKETRSEGYEGEDFIGNIQSLLMSTTSEVGVENNIRFVVRHLCPAP